jgi:hypothetical protein
MSVGSGEGVTWTSGGVFPIISAAGYGGTALWGAFLLGASHRAVLRGLGIIVSLSLPVVLMLLGRGIGGSWVVVLLFAIAVGVVWVRYQAAGNLLMSALFATESWRDVQIYLFGIPHQTDAGILARHLGWSGLTLPVALSFALFSAAVWIIMLRYVLQRRPIDGSPIYSTLSPKDAG